MTTPQYFVPMNVGGGRARFVRQALRAAGWSETKGDAWDWYWQTEMPPMARFGRLAPGRWINHFPGIGALTIKTRLYETLDRARRRIGPQVYDFFPRVFALPDEYDAFVTAADAAPEALWIQKPRALSRGRGISMVENPAKVPRHREWMVQAYLDRPDLIDGCKYTLRFYVLIAGLDPLRVYMYRDGFAKLASRRFTTDRAKLGDRFVHLTNPDVQALNPEVSTSSRNLTHGAYRALLRERGADDAALWRRIRELIAKTAIAARTQVALWTGRHAAWSDGCFEHMGFDVLVDRDLKPWLIECNLGPSIGVHAESGSDHDREEAAIKRGLCADLVSLVGAARPKQVPSTPMAEVDGVEAVERVVAERTRAGGFSLVYPAPDTAHAAAWLETPTARDRALAEVLSAEVPDR